MQRQLASLLLLARLRKRKNAAQSAEVETQPEPNTDTKEKSGSVMNWLTIKPKPIEAYPGEVELFRKGPVLVTDTRIAYIDPYDRMLKTYMFEHMISVHKQHYLPTTLNRRFCIGLLFISIITLVIAIIFDIVADHASAFKIVYIPILASIAIGFKAWHDMKPKYVVHWRMRDLTYGEMSTEPYFRERIMNSKTRETFMDDLTNAMNKALSGKAWWPSNGSYHRPAVAEKAAEEELANDAKEQKPSLTLVTESYQ